MLTIRDEDQLRVAFDACTRWGGVVRAASCLGLPEFEQPGNTDNEVLLKARTAYSDELRRPYRTVIPNCDNALSYLDGRLGVS